MKKAVCGIAAALLVIVLAVMVKNVYSCKIPIGNRGIHDCLAYGKQNALFVGSSSFRSNLDINVLDEKYDGKSYILSYGGNQYVACDIQYDELGDASELYVFEMDPLMLTEDVKLSDSRVIWDLTFEGKRKLWKKMCESQNTDTGFKVWYEYFVTSGMDDLVTYPVTEPFYSTRYYKGAKTDEVVSPGKEYLDNEKFNIDDAEIVAAQEEAVLELIAKCKRDNREFLFLETPHYCRLAQDKTYMKYKEYFLGLLEREGVRCITCEDTGFDNTNPDYFEDMGHMTNLGREEYTKMLTKIL